jgi:hypothetical protein
MKNSGNSQTGIRYLRGFAQSVEGSLIVPTHPQFIGTARAAGG